MLKAGERRYQDAAAAVVVDPDDEELDEELDPSEELPESLDFSEPPDDPESFPPDDAEPLDSLLLDPERLSVR